MSENNINPIFFLARSLHMGGAERQLVELAKGLFQRGYNVKVVVFYTGGMFDAELLNAGIPLINLNKKNRWDIFPFLSRFLCLHIRTKPILVQSYLAVPNLLSLLLKPLLPNTRIIWGLRASNMDLSRYDWLARLSYWLECRLSRFADLIIANSQAGKQYAVNHGFRADKMIVIPNGIDSDKFHLDPTGRQQVRAEWGISEQDILVGLVARLDPMKDHPNFIAAANIVVQTQPNVRFVCVGSGTEAYSESLKQQAASLGDRLIWAGTWDDMSAAYSAFDIASSSSCFGEGFSNSIAEAMACERPCVVTDVGDSAWIVGDASVVVPASDPKALADGLLKLVNLPCQERANLGAQARIRIKQNFSIDALIIRTAQALELS